MPQREPVDLSGTVSNYNLGPRGEVEALMIKSSDKTIQVNLPPPLSPFAVQVATVGAQVTIKAYPEMGLPDHPIYELASVKNEQGRELKQPSPDDRKFVHEEGTIKSLNYARHGEINGAILDSGDFVHLGPPAVTIKLTVGQKITIDGVGHPMMLSEHRAVEAVAIDGKMLQPAEQPVARGGPQDGGPDEGPDRPGGRRGARGRGGQVGPRGAGGPDGLDRPDGPGSSGEPRNRPGPRRGDRGRPGTPPDGTDAPPPPPQRGHDYVQPPPQINDEPGGQLAPPIEP
jgi:hypothetical protein